MRCTASFNRLRTTADPVGPYGHPHPCDHAHPSDSCENRLMVRRALHCLLQHTMHDCRSCGSGSRVDHDHAPSAQDVSVKSIMRSQNLEWPRSRALQQGSCPCRSWVFTCAGCHDRRWPAVSGAYLRKPLSQLMRKSVDAYMVVVSPALHVEVMPCTGEMVAKHREKRSSISLDGLFRGRWYQPL